jgi:quercetin dioxygenase-like cupin family protein
MRIIACGAVLFLVLSAFLAPGGSQHPPASSARFPQFENDQVKVWKSVIAPNLPLAMHRHDHPRVIVALRGGTIRIVEEGGVAEPHHWETGKAYWLPANSANRLHADLNAGERPIEVMVVELKHEK